MCKNVGSERAERCESGQGEGGRSGDVRVVRGGGQEMDKLW